jgi:hypothetical protein
MILTWIQERRILKLETEDVKYRINERRSYNQDDGPITQGATSPVDLDPHSLNEKE